MATEEKHDTMRQISYDRNIMSVNSMIQYDVTRKWLKPTCTCTHAVSNLPYRTVTENQWKRTENKCPFPLVIN